MTAPIPKRAAFEAIARELAARHTAWDVPHRLYALHLESDGRIGVGAERPIELKVAPDAIPQVIMKMASKHIGKLGSDATVICGWALAYEAFGVTHEKGRADMTPEERAQFDRDVRARRLYTREDAKETAMTIVADLRGRCWLTYQARGQESDIDVSFCGTQLLPGDGGQVDGRFAVAMRAIGFATASAVHGLPIPGGWHLPGADGKRATPSWLPTQTAAPGWLN